MPFSPYFWVGLTLILAVCVVVQFILIRSINRRFSMQSHMMRSIFNGPNDEDLEALWNRNFEESRKALENSEQSLEIVQKMEARFGACLQNFAIVRYDAFDDVTGQMSFSLALLDGQGNGSIVTSIFGRSMSRCFGKIVVAGKAEQPLSQEEQQALCEALQHTEKLDLTQQNAAILQKEHSNGHYERTLAA